jgi:hypothetical protein
MNRYSITRLLVPLFLTAMTACSPAALIPTPTAGEAPSPTSASTATDVPTAAPTPTPAPIEFAPPAFAFYGNDPAVPVMTREPASSFKNLYINPGAVLFHEGEFHMFFNSFTNWPGLVKIGYAVSTDG